MSSGIGLEVKLVISDIAAAEENAALIRSFLQRISPLMHALNPDLSSTVASGAPLITPELVSASEAAGTAEAKAHTTRKTRTKVAAPAPVEAPLKQGDKTATIRAYVFSTPDGVTPKQILKYLRDNFAWARASETLANTVHTSLNNMQKRGQVSFDPATRLFFAVPDSQAGTAEVVAVADLAQVPAEPADSAGGQVEPEFDGDLSTSPEPVEVSSAAETQSEDDVESAVTSSDADVSDEEMAEQIKQLRASQKPVPGLFK